MDRVESTPVRMVSAVLVTCIVSASSLAFTYELTSERIAEQERLARERALMEVVPGATDFSEVGADLLADADEAAGDTPVDAVYLAGTDSGGEAYGILVSPRGYGGPIQMVVGMDRDGSVLGVSIITQNETPGLGTKIMTEPGFLEQFEGWDGFDIDASNKEFDSISGATKSSSGVRKGVLAAGYAFEAVEGRGSGGEVSDE